MKVYKPVILLLIASAISLPAVAAEKPSPRWDDLMEIAYKFTWYPRQDLQTLLEKKSEEYEQTLEEYQELLIAELTDHSRNRGAVRPELFVSTKPWKLYHRLAIAQFCSFLVNDDDIYLKNAQLTLAFLGAKKQLPEISFWHYVFKSYNALMSRDRDLFLKSIFKLWQDVILNLEIEGIINKNRYNSVLVNDLPFLYENIAHLIVTKAILEKQTPNLYPLSVIIMLLKERMSIDNGYKSFLEAICERLHGLKSDNCNLNYAVAFVEATANQYEFEGEKSIYDLSDRYHSARIQYEYTLSLAETYKGKAAILTQYMGFDNYIIRRLADKDDLFARNSIFSAVPEEANRLVDTSIALYDQLAKSSARDDAYLQNGFHKRSNYIEAMHQLWDSTAKLVMTLSSYYLADHQQSEIAKKNIAEGLLLKYLALFDRYARVNNEIVPDNAFFLAAYAATRLSDLYREAAKYSRSMEVNNKAFTYQLQAVDLFPLDILGILKLALQVDRESRRRLYFQYVVPLASRLRDSKVIRIWLDKHSSDYYNNVAITTNVIPNIVANAFLYIRLLQKAEISQTEEKLYNKLIIMSNFHTALLANDSDELIPEVLMSILKHDITEEYSSLDEFSAKVLPTEIKDIAMSIPKIQNQYSISLLKNKLYASPDTKFHSFLRELYYENSVESHQYLLLLQNS